MMTESRLRRPSRPAAPPALALRTLLLALLALGTACGTEDDHQDGDVSSSADTADTTGNTDGTGTDASDSEDVADDTADAVDTAETDDDAADTGDAGPVGCKTTLDCPQGGAACQANVCVGGVCEPQVLSDGTACDDGAPCTATATCQGGDCKAVLAVDCDDGTNCTIDSCDPLTGVCVHAPTAGGEPCADNNPCTEGTVCDGKGACAGGANACPCESIQDCAVFDDQNACNGTLFCDTSGGKGLCAVLPGSEVVCPEAEAGGCSQNVCAPLTGECVAVPAKDGAPCDDGSSCTAGETCSNGACKAATSLCQCTVNADCAAHEDGNACNGTLYCDTAKWPYTCRRNPASVVVCAKPAHACEVVACDPKTGGCNVGPAPDGTACDDGNAKTVGDACAAGVCKPGTSVAQCTQDADCAKFEDGNYCNGTLFCNVQAGLCQLNPATLVACPSADDTACAQNVCDKKSGLCKMAPVHEGEACADANPCTIGETCQAGQCEPSAQICQCQADADCGKYEDGNACNGTLFCNKVDGSCQLAPSTVVNCPSALDTACSQNTCDPKTGQCAMKAAPNGSDCDDGDSCTNGEACTDGQCLGTKTCECQSDTDCAAKEDGNLCNGTLFCNKKKGACEINPATVKTCSQAQDGPCIQAKCQPETGACKLVPRSNGAVCDADDNPCTAQDYCNNGVCKAGKSVCGCYTDADCAGKQGDDLCVLTMACDPATFTCKPKTTVTCETKDDTACKLTACDPKDGVCKSEQLDVGTPCADSKTCTPEKVCDANGACAASTGMLCDDADACTADSCDASLGCVHLPLDSTGTNLVPCDDGNVCTTQDRCSKGNCVGVSKDCSDTNVCTADACDPALGCVYAASGQAVCDDGSACTVGDFCVQTVCVPGPKPADCDDGNPCTEDGCEPKLGCTNKAKAGAPCDDGNACTTGDVCTGGVCGGEQALCDDGSTCTIDSCIKAFGCLHQPLPGAPCNDGSTCTESDACGFDGVCTGKPVAGNTCDDGNVCTDDACVGKQGCTHTPNTGACSDGDFCTDKDVCVGGSCKGGGAVSCDDGSTCTTDLCIPVAGCMYIPAADGTSCKGTPYGTCSDGKCLDTPCPIGYEIVETDDAGKTAKVCAAQTTLWGARPLSPKGVYQVEGDTVLDTQTGLRWQRTGSATLGSVAAAHAACEALELGGKTDWRLPTSTELLTLLDFSVADGTTRIDATAFPDTAQGDYWTRAYSPKGAGIVHFGSGWATTPANTGRWRCVRTEKLIDIGPEPFWSPDDPEQTASAVGAALMWAIDSPNTLGFNALKAYCDNLTIGGKADWRVPTVRELLSLHIGGQSIIGKPFTSHAGDYVSSTIEPSTGQVFIVSLNGALEVKRQPGSLTGLTRCVRSKP